MYNYKIEIACTILCSVYEIACTILCYVSNKILHKASIGTKMKELYLL